MVFSIALNLVEEEIEKCSRDESSELQKNGVRRVNGFSSPEPARAQGSKVWARPRSSIDVDSDGDDLKSKLRKMQQTLTRVKVRKDPVGSFSRFFPFFELNV